MSAIKVELGGLYIVPGSDRFALAKVIFKPKDFRNVILIQLHREAYATFLDVKPALSSIKNDANLYYTGDAAIKSGCWKIIGVEAISEAERSLTKRIIGGSVWIEDKCIGPASAEDFFSLKKMDIHPYRLVEKYASRLEIKASSHE
jgi:hypothetical protein